MSSKRIVVTGMGVVSPLGCGVEHVWKQLLDGRSGIVALPADVVEGIEARVAGVVPARTAQCPEGFDPDTAADIKERRKMDRFILFALAAAKEALAQAGWAPQSDEARARTATVVGSGIGGFISISDSIQQAAAKGPRRLSPFTIPRFLANMAAANISIQHGLRGPIGAPVTACAAGVQAIGDAARLIRSGEADVALCGGSEACIDRFSLGAFAVPRALSAGRADEPGKSSRPFDQARDGFVMGEGAGLLVIEELEHALRRGATPIAELVGYGTTSDAFHITCTPVLGCGARGAMELALRQAGISAADVQHLNAHATSTPLGDVSELQAIKSVFGGGTGPAISATKSSTGHLLGAAGGIEALFTVLAIRDQVAPATLNLEAPDEAAQGMDIVHRIARPMNIEHAMSNGFGFGGVNASVVFRRYP